MATENPALHHATHFSRVLEEDKRYTRHYLLTEGDRVRTRWGDGVITKVQNAWWIEVQLDTPYVLGNRSEHEQRLVTDTSLREDECIILERRA